VFGTSSPSTLYLMEARDRGVMAFQASKYLAKVVARVFPTPRRYSLAWSHPRGKDHLYVWRAISPDDDYIALGCVATTGEQAAAGLRRIIPEYHRVGVALE
jgi:hypothetical protein